MVRACARRASFGQVALRPTVTGMPNDFQRPHGQRVRACRHVGDTLHQRCSSTAAIIRNSDFHQVVMRGVEIVDTTIDGEIQNLVINGVDVAPLVEAELDRRYPDRPKFRPTTADGFREAWDLNERLWAATVERARTLRPASSCTSRWTASGRSSRRCGTWRSPASPGWAGASSATPRPWHPLSLPWDEMQPRAGVPTGPRRPPVARRGARPAARRRWRWSAAWSTASPTSSSTSETAPLVGPGWPDEGETVPRSGVPAHRAQRGVAAPPVRRA